MKQTDPGFYVLCIRTAESRFGYAEALLKDAQGNEKSFPTWQSAESEADRLNERVRRPASFANVYYQPCEITL